MLRTTKSMKEKYEKIQNCLFDIILEKWEEIYLYASVVDINEIQTGELYFYYLPKGILRKKLVNVYEVPSKFNIDENQYMQLVKKLYEAIKDLRKDFIETEQKVWTNLTISIVNCKFKVEYGYEEIKLDEISSNVRHVIWKYKYLGLGGEIKEERKILDQYFSHDILLEPKRQVYESGIYLKKVNNTIDFEKQEQMENEYNEEQHEQELKDDNKEIPKKKVIRNQILND